jgi:hypothetical protein
MFLPVSAPGLSRQPPDAILRDPPPAITPEFRKFLKA